jgi:hypothetical protein
MIRRILGAFAILAITGAVISPARDTWTIRMDGVGRAKIGMNLSELNFQLREKFSMPSAKEDQNCFYVVPTKNRHISFMMIDGRLARIDVLEPGAATTEGIQVGDSEKRALKVYGSRLKVEPHFYTGPEGHYLTAQSSDGRYGVRFETDGVKILLFYAGSFEAIQYVEGCE